jgi:MYXO-CTERM domain-containing protein
VVYATAAFDSFTIDSRSGNNEGGALHESIADFVSASYGQDSRVGEYVGPRLGSGEGSLRDLLNSEKCPGSLQGEVHQDSQHFSGALWEARKELFQGSDQGRTFDAAIYAALVSMTPATNFAQAAALVSAQLPIAFPAVIDAGKKMDDLFAARGVTGCSKVVDVTNSLAAREYYGLGGTQQARLANGTVVPGPYQLRVGVSAGAKSITVKATIAANPIPGSAPPTVHLLAKENAPITFTPVGSNGLSHDARTTTNSGTSTGAVTLKAVLAVPCGGALFFTFGNSATVPTSIRNVTFTVEPADSCAAPDAGAPPDAGGGGGDPYTVPKVPDGETGKVAPGCGCQSTPAAALALLALVALALFSGRRRRA